MKTTDISKLNLTKRKTGSCRLLGLINSSQGGNICSTDWQTTRAYQRPAAQHGVVQDAETVIMK